MARKLLLLSLYFLLQSCGILIGQDVMNGETRQYGATNPVFVPYVEKFENDAEAINQTSNFHVGDIPINFGDTRKDTYDGVCLKYPNGDREIIIKKSWWDNTDVTQREVLIYHELGHCRLNRSHDDSTYLNQKTSIMNPIVPTSYSYNQHKFGYLSELFTGNKQSIIDALTL